MLKSTHNQLLLLIMCFIQLCLFVANGEEDDDSDINDSSSTPAVVMGIIAGIAIIALIVILIAFCLRYVANYILLFCYHTVQKFNRGNFDELYNCRF